MQSIIILALNITFLENKSLIQLFADTLEPLTGITVFLADYGLNLIVRMIAPKFPHQKLIGKYFAFQLIWIFIKIQPMILQFLLKYFISVCYLPYTIPMQKNGEITFLSVLLCQSIYYLISAVIQIMLLCEMNLFQIWFHMLYRKTQDQET